MQRKNIYEIEENYYDFLYGDFRGDIDFYLKTCRGNILELMCGTGRITVPLSEIFEIEGIDINERMIDEASKKGARCYVGDVRSTVLNKKYDTVIIPLNSILLFDSFEKENILKNSDKMLNDDGIIIIDTLPPPELEEFIMYFGDHKYSENLDIWRFFIPEYSRDMKRLKLIYIYDIFENGNYRRESADLILFPEDLDSYRQIFKDSGFEIKNLYGDYDLSEYVDGESSKMIFILEKEL
ncbi:MAG: methyltransferase domain-containing protein [Thermoplasmata archaeon]